jgi:hypothetical protein
LLTTPITIHGGKFIAKNVTDLQEEHAARRASVDEYLINSLVKTFGIEI